MNHIWNLVSSTMLILCWIALNPSAFEGERRLILLQNAFSRMTWNFRLNFLVLLTKLDQKHFGRLKFKICGFYVKYNTRLKYNNIAPFLLHNYLLKCARHMLDVLSTENLPIHHKILTGLKDQFDLHKLLYFFHESKTCILRLIFLLMFFGEGWRNKYF